MQEQFALFKELLKQGIGSRTNTEFAKLAGVSAEWISRTLNKDNIPKPSISTLKKIAPHMDGVTLDALLNACGYDTLAQPRDIGVSRLHLSMEERLEENTEDIKNGLATMIAYKQFWSSIDEFFSHFEKFFAVEALDYIVEEDGDYKEGLYRGVERSMVVNFRWKANSQKIDTLVTLYYLRTEQGRVFFFGYQMFD